MQKSGKMSLWRLGKSARKKGREQNGRARFASAPERNILPGEVQLLTSAIIIDEGSIHESPIIACAGNREN